MRTESTLFYLNKKSVVISKELNSLFDLNKQFCEMKRETNFKFDPSMPKGYQVFSLLRDFIDIFGRSKVDMQKRQEASYLAIQRENRYEVSLMSYLENFIKRIKLFP